MGGGMTTSHRRIFFYSHDTVGLGHIRRTQKIANRLAGADRSILIACASPVASSYLSEKGIEYLNLPGFTKLMTGEYVPRNLNVSMDEFVSLRASILLAAISSFKPDLIVIDKEPLGVRQELRPALQYIRETKPECQIVCGFRDILDDPAATATEWERKGTLAALRGFFDKIYVYGDRGIFDFSSAYNIPADLEAKIEYTGYVHPDKNREPVSPKPGFIDDSLPFVTFTLGGGGDGESFISTVLALAEQGIRGLAFNTLLLTGPFIERDLLARTKELEARRGDFRAIRFTTNAQALFEKSDLVVSMGGYNTMCELIALGKFPLVIPRVLPRVEQLMRAKLFQEKGLCDFLDPRELSVDALALKVKALLARGDVARMHFPADGLAYIEASVERLLQ